jgi:hypothetical protein
VVAPDPGLLADGDRHRARLEDRGLAHVELASGEILHDHVARRDPVDDPGHLEGSEEPADAPAQRERDGRAGLGGRPGSQAPLDHRGRPLAVAEDVEGGHPRLIG